ncbi:LexA family transcriptional regulator [Pseudomonas bananamidigenes]|uniref:LexA family transcriptional regulator n=1 Tax=Pseudomonas bananamidigenes TaxID=2843610 RepID=UPI0009E20011|nr:XRE family transcriptional regulator [Pseudomonas bananamidigenes]
MDTDKPTSDKPVPAHTLTRKRGPRSIVEDPIRDEEARLLKMKYQARKKIDPELNQEKIADLCGWAGQSVVSQYLNGKIALNFSALVKFASILKFDPREVSPRLVASHPQINVDHIPPIIQESVTPTANLGAIVREEAAAYGVTPAELWDDKTPLGEDEVALPFFREVELSDGQGNVVMLDEYGRKYRLWKGLLQQKNIHPEDAAVVVVTGNSMVPVLPPGSLVAIDVAPGNIEDGKMYAVDHDGLIRITLLYRMPGGGVRLKSYNNAEHPEERYDGAYVREHIQIMGKVFWYSVIVP